MNNYKIVFFRGLKFKIRQDKIVEYKGVKMPIDLLIIYKIFLQQIYNPVNFEINNNDTIIDIGAHIGAFTIYAAMHAQHGVVYSYEPHPENYALLVENVKLNNFDKQVKAFNLAVFSKSQEKIKLYVSNNNTSGHSIFFKTFSYIEVKSVSLKDIFIDNNIEKCDFLKIDCEGAECEILMDTPPELFEKILKISLEFHKVKDRERSYSIENLIKYLKNYGYKIFTMECDKFGPTEYMVYCQK